MSTVDVAPKEMGLRKLLPGNAAGATETLYECRDCGTTLPPEADECAKCGSDEVASYTF